MVITKIGIIGMGTTGLSAAQQFYDLIQQHPEFNNKIEIHLFDTANSAADAGGQVKSYHDPITNKTSELGAVIIFPSWKNINTLIKRYNIETQTAPFAMQRFGLGGIKAPPLVSWKSSISFLIQLNNYRRLFASKEYKRMFEEGSQAAPEDLLTTVQEWATKNNIKLVVDLFQEFYSGCGYGQNIWQEPALYVSLLMTPEVVMELVKNSFNLHNVRSVAGGYQKLWVTIAGNLEQNSNFCFHYNTAVTAVTQHQTYDNKSTFVLEATNLHLQFDKIIFANSPSSIQKIFKSAYDDPQFDLITKTLSQSTSLNYQVAIAQLNYKTGIKHSKPSTRFFYESYRSRSDQKSIPVLDIMMHGEDKSSDPIFSDNHMLYYYGNKGQAAITEDTVRNGLKEYNCDVHAVTHVENWNDYHQHFSIHELKAGALKILHQYNLKSSSQIVGSITAMGHTEATITQGILAAKRIFNQIMRY